MGHFLSGCIDCSSGDEVAFDGAQESNNLYEDENSIDSNEEKKDANKVNANCDDFDDIQIGANMQKITVISRK